MTSHISCHLNIIYETGELQPDGTVAEYATVQNEGGRSVFRHLEYDKQDGQK